jgi:hypothetical protein
LLIPRRPASSTSQVAVASSTSGIVIDLGMALPHIHVQYAVDHTAVWRAGSVSTGPC